MTVVELSTHQTQQSNTLYDEIAYGMTMYQIELTESQIETLLFCLKNISDSTEDYLDQNHYPPAYLIEELEDLLEGA